MNENNKSENFKLDIHTNHVKSVLDILGSKKFSYSAEIIPPRNGTDFLEVFSHIEELEKSQFDFISVTHGAGGSLRGGTLPIAYHSQNAYNLTSIAHLTCRGMTAEELENLLIDHHYFGIHNILALRGDPPDGLNETFQPAAGGFSYAYDLVRLIKNVNAGKYLKRSGFDSSEKEYREGIKTRFCIGVACYPEDKNGKDIEYLKIKKETGADFSISQIVFDFEIFSRFHDKCSRLWKDTFPIIPGIRVPTSYKQLKRMKDKFGINVPDQLLNDMEKAAKSEVLMQEVGVNWATDFVAKIKSLGVKGIHFFIMGNPQHAILVKHNDRI
ncbi:MAG: methylenetetrahydrofolate reductase [Spirochaetia bacterium]|nr:methylenetetrahydrofolate reductase [Spirochaetia bacterium]